MHSVVVVYGQLSISPGVALCSVLVVIVVSNVVGVPSMSAGLGTEIGTVDGAAVVAEAEVVERRDGPGAGP